MAGALDLRSLAIPVGLGMLAANQPRPYSQGPNTLGSVLGQGGVYGLKYGLEANKPRKTITVGNKVLDADTFEVLYKDDPKPELRTVGNDLVSAIQDPEAPGGFRTNTLIDKPDKTGSSSFLSEMDALGDINNQLMALQSSPNADPLKLQSLTQQKKFLEKKLSQQEQPAAILQEMNWLKTASREEKETYWQAKRAGKVFDTGLGFSYAPPSDPSTAVPVVDESGKPIVQEVGAVETEKLMAKAGVEKTVQNEARARVTGSLQRLDTYYNELDKMGAALNVDKPTSENILNAIASSDVGQFFGAAAATKSQSIRNQINSMRPLLVQEIRKATEMGAKGMDSNKELEFYLNAATNPQKDLQSNKAAIAVLDAAYGLGLGVNASASEKQKLKNEFTGGSKDIEDPLGIR